MKSSPAPAPTSAPAAGRFNGELLRDPQFRQAMGDIVRIGIGADYREEHWGVLRLMTGAGYEGSAASYYLNRLWTAYMLTSEQEASVVIELWRDGRKFGEFTSDGLLVGPEFSSPR